jgi:hypothetical protein
LTFGFRNGQNNRTCKNPRVLYGRVPETGCALVLSICDVREQPWRQNADGLYRDGVAWWFRPWFHLSGEVEGSWMTRPRGKSAGPPESAPGRLTEDDSYASGDTSAYRGVRLTLDVKCHQPETTTNPKLTQPGKPLCLTSQGCLPERIPACQREMCGEGRGHFSPS